MLYILLIYFFISLICLLTGILFYELLPFSKESSDFRRSPVLYLISGLIIITGIAQWLVIFLPLNIIISAGLFIIVILLSVIYKKRVLPCLKAIRQNFSNQSLLSKLGLLVFLVMILVLNAGLPIMDDTDSYHIQTIKWIQEYGTVTGLANLHLRFGFNSSWFSSIGILSPHFGNINSYLILNGLLSCWFCQYIFEKSDGILSKATGSINQFLGLFVVLVACLVLWPAIRGNAASANYDFITTCCIVILFIEVSLSKNKTIQPEWLLWPLYLFTIRIINFPLLLLCLILIVQLYRARNFKLIANGVLMGLFLIIPFITRNVMLSGYAFFPAYQFDVFSVSWKADKQMAINIVEYIKYYNRVNIMYRPLEETSKLGFPGWITSWYHYLFTYDKLLLSVSGICYVACLAGWKRIRKQLSANSTSFFIALLLQLFAWFFIAPDIRFAYGPLLCGLVLFFFLFPMIPVTPLLKNVCNAAIVLILAGGMVYTGKKVISENPYQDWVSPHPLPVPPARKIVIDGIEMNIPQKILGNWNPRCYGTSLPCLYWNHPGLRAIGKNISDGFYIDYSISYTPKKWEWY